MLRIASPATHAATCAATTPNTACTVALELAKADAPRPSDGFRLAVFQSEDQPPRRIDSAHRTLANDFSQLIGHTNETPLEHRMLGELTRKRRESTVAPAAIQRLELVENRIAHGVDRSFALAGEPEAKVGQISRRVLSVNLHRASGGSTFTPIPTHIPPAWTSEEMPASLE